MSEWEKEIDEALDRVNNTPKIFSGFHLWRSGRKLTYHAERLAQVKAFKEAVNQYELAKLDEETKLETHGRSRKALESQIEANIATAVRLQKQEECLARLTEAAAALGMTVEHNSEVNKTKALVDIDVDKAKKLKDVEYEYEKKIAFLEADMAIAFKMEDVGHATRLLGIIHSAKKERHSLVYSGQPINLIQELLRDYDRHIAALEAKHARLLQIDDGENKEGGIPPTVGSGDFRQGLGAGQEQTSSSLPGDE